MPGLLQKVRLWIRRWVRFAIRLVLKAVFVGQRPLTYAEDLGPTQIRLLRPVRRPGALSLPGVLSLALEVVDIEDKPDYVALSYTWGPADADDRARNAISEKLPIYVNSSRLDVFPNLFDALTELVRSGFDGRIWIDAICINQDDSGEQTAQVGMMDQIYKTASSTILWLGREDGHTARAAKALARCASPARQAALQLLASPKWADPIVPWQPRPLDKYGMPLLLGRDWNDLADIYGRRYFGRAWMAQEVALARQLQVRIGRVVCEWKDLGTLAVFLLLANVLSALEQYPRVVPGSNQLVSGAMCVFRLHLTRLWCQPTEDPELARSLERFTALEREPKTFGLGLLELVGATPSDAASDLRDRIFSKYGIMKHLMPHGDSKKYRPEYTDTKPAEIFKRFTTAVIEDTVDMRILTFGGSGYSEVLDTTKPSWVPEYDGTVSRPANMLAFPSWSPTALKFNASGSAADPDRTGITVQGNTLRVHAVQVGLVVARGNTTAELIEKYAFAETADMLLHHYAPVNRQTGQSRTEEFWRSIITDQDMTNRPAAAELGESFRAWFCLLLILGIRALLQKGLKLPEVENAYATIDRIASEESPPAQFFPRWTEMLERLVQSGFVAPPKGWSGPKRAKNVRELLWGWIKLSRQFEMITGPVARSRRLIALDSGHMAFGPMAAAVGDSAWIVAGCPVPLLLRRAGGDGGDQASYRILGETYIHGIMAGEAISAETEWKSVLLI